MKNRMLWHIVLILIISTPIVAQTPEELIGVRDAYAQAMNDHDFNLMETYMAEGFVYDLVSMPPPFGKDLFRWGMEGYFQDPIWHTDEGYVGAVDNIVVVDHNSVATGADGVVAASPHLDIYEFEGTSIKKVTTYGDNLNQAIASGQVPPPVMPPLVPSQPLPDPEPTGLSPLEAHAEHVQRWSDRDIDAVARMYHTDCRIKAGPMVMTFNRDEMMALNEAYFDAFPGGQLRVIRTIDLGGGWVLTELVSESVHQSPFMGVPASGYPIAIRTVWLTRYTTEGLAIEGSFHYDGLTLLTQMTTPPIPLDGIWVSAVPTPFGNLLLTTTYVAQDAAKTRYSGSLDEVNPMPVLSEIFPDADPNPKWAGGQAVMVGRDKYEATYLGYARKLVDTEMGSMMEIVGLFTINAHFEVTGPDSLQGQGAGSYYLAIQDADGDGYPDEGEEPIACVPWQWTGKKVGILPGCVPAPMPEP